MAAASTQPCRLAGERTLHIDEVLAWPARCCTLRATVRPGRLVNKIAPFGMPLRAGEVVLAGSFKPPVTAAAGDNVHAACQPLGTPAMCVVRGAHALRMGTRCHRGGTATQVASVGLSRTGIDRRTSSATPPTAARTEPA